MNLSDLKKAVAEKTGTTESAASPAVQAVLDVITAKLQSGGSVNLTGFGAFSVSERAARTGRNPQTGETIEIAASKTVKFKAGKGLKDTVNA